jgi:hypothetical protein
VDPSDPFFRIDGPARDGCWYIGGLGTLRYISAEGIDQLLPFREWIRCMVGSRPTAALLDGWAISEEGLPPGLEAQCIEVPASVYFGALTSGGTPGRLVPEIDSSLLTGELINRYWSLDCLGVLAGVRDQERVLRVLREFTTEDDTIRRLGAECEWVIVSGHDEQYIKVFTEIADPLEELTRCCLAADEAIKRTPWFAETAPQLAWCDWEECYRLAHQVRERKE